MTIPNTSLYILDNTGALVANISSVQAPLSLVTQSGYSATLTPLPQVPLTVGGTITITAGNAAAGYAPGSVNIQPGAAGLNNASVSLLASNGANVIKVTQTGTTPKVGFFNATPGAQQGAVPSYIANYTQGTSLFVINATGVISNIGGTTLAAYDDLGSLIVQVNQLTSRVNSLAAALKNLGITL